MLNPNDSSGNVINLPRNGEGFIAETAIKLDRLQALVSTLDRDTRESKKALSELTDLADRSRRTQAFEESLRNAREYKIDELVRSCRDLKTRLDYIEGNRAKFTVLPCNTFEAINDKLVELEVAKETVERSSRRTRIVSFAFCALATLIAGLPYVSGFI